MAEYGGPVLQKTFLLGKPIAPAEAHVRLLQGFVVFLGSNSF